MLFRSPGEVPGRPQYYNLEHDLKIFEYQYKDSMKGLFSTRDGAWASYGGSVGPQPENRILIAQLTTDGVFRLCEIYFFGRGTDGPWLFFTVYSW